MKKTAPKPLEHYLTLPYKIELHPEQEGGFTALHPELPGCMTQGETAEEALQMLQEAKELWLETSLEMGLHIPEPAAQTYSGKFVVRVAPALHRKLSEGAEAEGISLNQYVVALLSEAHAVRSVTARMERLESCLKQLEGKVDQVVYSGIQQVQYPDISYMSLPSRKERSPYATYRTPLA